MVEITLLASVVAVVVGVAGVRSHRFRKKIRKIEWKGGFIRLYPNPGLKIGNFHACSNKKCRRWSKIKKAR